MNLSMNLTISAIRSASCSINSCRALRTFDTTKIINSTLLHKPIFNKLMKKNKNKKKRPANRSPTNGLNENELKHFRQLDRLIKSAKLSKSNKNDRLILLEGKILIEEALRRSQIKLSHLFYTSKLKLDQLKLSANEKERLSSGEVILHETNESLINKWSHLQTNQGLLAVAKLKVHATQSTSPSLPLTLVLDNIRDPGNMGTMIRTAAAVGFEKILLTKGSVNPWNPKVLRAAMGAHFCVPIYSRLNFDQIVHFLKQSSHVLVADSQQDRINSVDYTNLANILPNIQAKPSGLNLTLIMSNETRGISDELLEIEHELNKQHKHKLLRVNIPLSNQVESLNCSIAFAILSYELRRLLKTKM